MTEPSENIGNWISEAVAHYWQTRKSQREKQKMKGVSDAGRRSAVTGGAQMDGFIRLFTRIVVDAGMQEIYPSWKMNPYTSSLPPLPIGI